LTISWQPRHRGGDDRAREAAQGRDRGLAFLIELAALKGREKLAGYQIATLISY